MEIGKKIKSLRESRGMTLEELGKKTGQTRQVIFKYETGLVTNIPIDKITKIATALDCSPAFLLGWEDNDDKKTKYIIPEESKHLSVAFCDGLKGLTQDDIDDFVKYMNFIKSKKK